MLAAWQIILITLWAGFGIIDGYTLMSGMYANIALNGVVVGLISGNVALGLLVGGTMQMLALGIAGIGGSSVPDYRTAAILVTALAGNMCNAQEYIAKYGIPVAALVIQLDVLAKMANTFIQAHADKAIAEGNYRRVQTLDLLGMVPMFLSRAVPVFLGLVFGPTLIKAINSITPVWMVSGFKIAGAMLPIVGFVILLKNLPVKKSFQFLLLGFLLSAFFNVNVLGSALIGLVVTICIYQFSKTDSGSSNHTDGNGSAGSVASKHEAGSDQKEALADGYDED